MPLEGVNYMRVIRVKNSICKCDNCNNKPTKIVDMEFIKVHLCDKCSKNLIETLKGEMQDANS